MPQFGRETRDRSPHRFFHRRLSQTLLTIGLLALSVTIVAACSGLDDSGTQPEALQTQDARQNPSSPTTGSPTGSPGSGGEDPAALGQQLASQNGCTGCHSIDGSEGVGPTWQGLYGADVPLEDGSTVTADDAYIAESIRDPSAKIHEGFSDIMPKTFGEMSDEQVNAIIAYIQTLE